MFRIGDVEITKRELLISIAIVFSCLFIALFIFGEVEENHMSRNQVWYTARQIKTQEEFQWALDTNSGNVLVEGQVEGIDGVEGQYVNSKYFAVNTVTERYTEHEHTHYTYDDEGNVTGSYTTYTYSWDYNDSNEQRVKEYTLLGCKVSNLNINNYHRADLSVEGKGTLTLKDNYYYKDNHWWDKVGDIRYYVEVIPLKFNVSLLAKTSNKNIVNHSNEKHGINTYQLTIEQLRDKETQFHATAFWVTTWIIIVLIVIAFVAIDNYWLED